MATQSSHTPVEEATRVAAALRPAPYYMLTEETCDVSADAWTDETMLSWTAERWARVMYSVYFQPPEAT